MSRIGKFPIPLPPKVEVTLAGGEITVKGPLGHYLTQLEQASVVKTLDNLMTFPWIRTLVERGALTLHAVDVSLRDRNWSEAERYAAALEDLSRPEPWPRCEFVVRQARALAGYGRGGRDPRLLTELAAMREECRSFGL